MKDELKPFTVTIVDIKPDHLKVRFKNGFIIKIDLDPRKSIEPLKIGMTTLLVIKAEIFNQIPSVN